jgi:ATPase family associated with various cellular activities (AAA)
MSNSKVYPTTSSLSSKVRTARSTLYIKVGDAYFAREALPKPLPALPAGVYEIKSTSDGELYLSPHEIQTDELIRFEDSRHQLVLGEIQKFWEAKPKFKESGFTHKRGMLLTGAPGCGKTCLLKQVMEDVVAKGDIVIYTSAPRMLKNVLSKIKDIEEGRNVLVIMEDIDTIIQYDEQSMLQMLDGDDQQEHVLYLATTNYPQKIPPRIMRPGRFDRKLEIGPIPEAGRTSYFRLKVARMGTVTEANIREYVDVTNGFSFAQMREFLVSVFCLGYGVKESAARIKNGTIEESMTEAELDAKLTPAPKPVNESLKGANIAKIDPAQDGRGHGFFSSISGRDAQRIEDFLATIKSPPSLVTAIKDILDDTSNDKYSCTVVFQLNDINGTKFSYYKQHGVPRIGMDHNQPYTNSMFQELLKYIKFQK